MSFKRILFIGGSKHGQKLLIPEDVHHWDTLVPENMFAWEDYHPWDVPLVYKREFYRKAEFRGKTASVEIMLLEGMASSDVLECLLTNYPDPPSDSHETPIVGSSPVVCGPIRRIIEV